MYIGHTKETDSSDQNGSGYTDPGRDSSRGGDVYTDTPGGSTGDDWMPGIILPPILPSDPRLNLIARITGAVGMESELKTALRNSTEAVVSMAELEFLLALFTNPANFYNGEKSANSWANEVLRNILVGKEIEAAKRAAYDSMAENPYISKEDEQKAQETIKQVAITKQSGYTFLILVGILIFLILRK